MFKSSLRKNYLLNNQTNIITQRRQESDSNSLSKNRSLESLSKRSLDNSYEEIKKEQINKKLENLSQLQQSITTMNINSSNNPKKLRSHSNNTAYNYMSSNIIGKNLLLNSKCKNTIQDFGYVDVLLRDNSENYQRSSKQIGKVQKSQISQDSTEQPRSLMNNFIVDDQRPGFVRFSQIIIDENGTKKGESKRGKEGSLSILKNRKNAISCSKIDRNYLKFRDKTVNQKQKALDITKTKYKQIVQGLRHKFYNRGGDRQYGYADLIQQQKYKDELFPANNQSIFFTKTKVDDLEKKYQQGSQYQFVEVGWKRMSQLFYPQARLVIYKDVSTLNVIKSEFSIGSNSFLLSLNAVRNVSQFFGKIFESSCDKYQKHGVYCLKVFQENAWKSILIDDLIPVIKLKSKKSQQIITKPLFLDIQVPPHGQQIEVWPFLLQKAYASYYNSYESLNQDFKIIDWLQQILMTPSQCHYFPDNEQLSQQSLKKLQQNIYQFPTAQSIIIGFNIKTKQPCIIQKRQSSTNQFVTIRTMKSQRKMKIKHLLQIIHAFYLFLPFHFKYSNTCPINFSKSKISSKQYPMIKIKHRQEIFERTFNVQEYGPFSIAIRQKQKRFYLGYIKKCQYLWNRVIIVQKQFGNSYRWIDGRYTNEKSINFNLYLEKGQYEVIFMPQLQPGEQLHDITMIILSNSQIGIQRKMYEQRQRLFERACCDIAQRKGNFTQLNNSTCSYSFIQKSTGIIIQNVNNQKPQGGLAITRSIAGLKARVQIYPFNLDFCTNQFQVNIHRRKYKNTVQVLIDAESSFTLVLMMKGGIDHKFLKLFKFTN